MKNEIKTVDFKEGTEEKKRNLRKLISDLGDWVFFSYMTLAFMASAYLIVYLLIEHWSK